MSCNVQAGADVGTTPALQPIATSFSEAVLLGSPNLRVTPIPATVVPVLAGDLPLGTAVIKLRQPGRLRVTLTIHGVPEAPKEPG